MNINVATAHLPRSPGRLGQHLFVPLVLVGGNAAAWAFAWSGSHAGVVAVVVAVVVISFAAERRWPYENAWNHNRGDLRRDLAHAIVNEALHVSALLVVGVAGTSLTIVHLWPTGVPFGAQVILAIVVADLGVTAGHWLSHRHQLLWRFHAVHHSVRRFYGLNGLMKHPLHLSFESLLSVAPLLALGLPLNVAWALAGSVSIQLVLQHSNVNYSTAGVGKVLALNHLHRFHHLRWAQRGDVNFGLFTTMGDRLLGTLVHDPSQTFTSDHLGIDAQPSYPDDYIAQLAEPFTQAHMPVTP